METSQTEEKQPFRGQNPQQNNFRSGYRGKGGSFRNPYPAYQKTQQY